jgi:hypothetical protein
MSTPSSPTQPPDTDFVLWPEAPEPGARLVNASAIKGSLSGLAPEEWGADAHDGAPPAGGGAGVTREERFYPASSQWFRSTAALPTVEGTEKWWQKDEAVTPPPSGEIEPRATAAASPLPEGPAPTGLLSPEEIWELAADELEQASRLGAPASSAPASSGLMEERVEAREADKGPSFLNEAPSPPSVEPLAAIPVPRTPLSLRSDLAEPPASAPRRSGPLAPVPPIFEDLGLSAAPEERPAAAAPALPSTPLEPGPVGMAGAGEGRRRRQRKERRRRSEAPRTSISWGRWIASLLGLLTVLAVAAAVVGRDRLPPEWGKTLTYWWSKSHQMVFPHQYGYPRRGVVLKAEPEVPNPPKSSSESGTSTPPPVVSDDPGESSTLPSDPEEAPGSATTPPPDPDPAVSEVGPDGGAPVSVVPRAELVGPDDAVSSEVAAAEAVTATPLSPAATGERESAAAAEEAAAPPSSAGGFTLWAGDAVSGDPEGDNRAAPAAEVQGSTASANAEISDAQKVVRQLLSARSLDEVLPWIFDSKTLESTVSEYHSRHPLQPLNDVVIEHQYSGVIPATGSKAHIFNVLDPAHPLGFPVSAEDTPDGYRIDWQSYIQWRDAWLRRFLDSKSSDPQTLFVVLRRTHYFNDDVPGLEDKHAFKVTSAVPGDEGAVAFVEKNSAIGRSLAELYEWRTLYFPVVELQWVPSGKESRYLRLNRIVRSSWRRMGD